LLYCTHGSKEPTDRKAVEIMEEMLEAILEADETGENAYHGDIYGAYRQEGLCGED
jgi:hypothetical protein